MPSGVTIQSTPASYTPAYNPQWFQATSTNTAQANFRYRVVLTDLISGSTVTKDVDADPSGVFIYDASGFAEQYITQLNPSGLYGFQNNTGAIRKVRVNIGEVYGTTPIYTAGASNTEYIVWNGALDTYSNEVNDMQNYSFSNYLYSQGNNIQVITNNHNPDYVWTASANTPFYSLDETVTPDRSSYMYFLTSAVGDLEKIRIIGYNEAGTPMGSTVIRNPSSGSTTYTDKYQFIDLGYDGLANMPSAQILSGTNPIPVSTYNYWIVYDESSWLPAAIAPADPFIYPLKRFNLVYECRYDVITLHYLSRMGSIETQPCTKVSVRKSQVNKSTYSKLPYTSAAYVMSYTYGSAIENTLSSNIRDSFTVNTDWLTEAEATNLKDLVSSPLIYVDFGNARGYRTAKMVTSTYEEKRKYNSQMIQASFDLEFTNINVRQKG